jgi:flagellar basal body-associated protein FliL
VVVTIAIVCAAIAGVAAYFAITHKSSSDTNSPTSAPPVIDSFKIPQFVQDYFQGGDKRIFYFEFSNDKGTSWKSSDDEIWNVTFEIPAFMKI